MAHNPDVVANLRALWSSWPENRGRAFETWLVGELDCRADVPGSEVTAVDYARGYTFCRSWAERRGLLQPGACDADFWTTSRIQEFIRDLHSEGYSAAQIRIALIALDIIETISRPEHDSTPLRRLLHRIPRRARARSKADRLQDSAELRDYGIEIMRAVLSRPKHLRASVEFRRGLEIAFLSLRPYRVSVFTAFEVFENAAEASAHIGPFLTRERGRYWLNHRAPKRGKRRTQTHDGRRKMRGGKYVPPRLSLPEELVPWLEIYLAIYRPLLCRNYAGRRLWVSQRGVPLTVNAIYKDVTGKTKAKFVDSLPPQLFRDCLATSLGRRTPDRPNKAHQILGNTPTVAGERYEATDPARSLEVSLRVSAIMDDYLEEPPQRAPS